MSDAPASRVSPPRGLEPRDWLLAAALLVVFAPAFVAMVKVWASTDYYSHGFLVPLVALWSMSRTRARRRRLAVAPGAAGLGLIGASLLVYAAGLAGGVVTLQGAAFVGAVAGAIWARRGVAWLRALAFPIGFLLFMVPLPEAWIAPTILALRLWVSQAAVLVCAALGVPVFREGNVLVLASGESLFVADACSGVTSLVTLTPLAVLLAHFTERSTLRRVLLVLSVVPIAFAGNLVRVVGTVLAAQRWGVDAASSGPLHDSAGLLTYALGCLTLLAVGALLRRAIPERAAA